MTLLQSFDPGTEQYIPYAKKKLRELHDYMIASGVAAFNKRVDVSDGTAMYFSSLLQGNGIFKDTIRVTGGRLFLASIGSYQGEEGGSTIYRSVLFDRQGRLISKTPVVTGFGEAWVSFGGDTVLYRSTLGGGDFSTTYFSRVSLTGDLLTDLSVSTVATGSSSAQLASSDAGFYYMALSAPHSFLAYDTVNGVLTTEIPALVSGGSLGNLYGSAADRVPDSVAFGALSVVVPLSGNYTDGVLYYKRDNGSAWVKHTVVSQASSYGDGVPRRFSLGLAVSGDGLKTFISTVRRVPDDATYGVDSSLSQVVYELYDDSALYATITVVLPVPITYGSIQSSVATLVANLSGSVTIFANNSVLDSGATIQRHGHVTAVDARGQFLLEEHGVDAQSYPKFFSVGASDDGEKVVYLRQEVDFSFTMVFFVRTETGYAYAAERANSPGTYFNPKNAKAFGVATDGATTYQLAQDSEGAYSILASTPRALAESFLANPVEPPADPPADKVPYAINLAGVFSVARGRI